MKKVLIALDYDPSAQKVAEIGFSFAKTMGAAVTLLHVMVDPPYYSLIGHVTIMGFAGHLDKSKVPLEKIDNPEKLSQQFLEKSKLHLGDNNIQTLVKDGDFAESILKTAKDLKADIIIMGSHSRKWFENIIIGSVTERVLLYTTIPVLIIPTKKHN
jgi:nucleotide-binding universal stress UspA family protein